MINHGAPKFSDPRVTAVLQLPGGALRPVGTEKPWGLRIYVSLPQDSYGAIELVDLPKNCDFP